MSDNNETNVEKKDFKTEITKNFWLSDYTFPIFVAILGAAIFAGTHMFYVHGTGFFNAVNQVSMMKAGMEEGPAAYSTAAAYGASFMFARILEGSLVGILDIGGSLHTGLGTGVGAMVLMTGNDILVESFPLALLTGGVIGFIMGLIIIFVKKFTVGGANSTFGADVMMGAGNASGKFLGPLLVISACMASIPVGVGSIIGAVIFYQFKRPISGGAILGAMVMGLIFPIIV